MNIRVRSPTGVINLRDLEGQQSAFSFVERLSNETKIPFDKIKVSFGFPPKILDASIEVPISKFFSNGETLTVVEGPAGTNGAPRHNPATSSSSTPPPAPTSQPKTQPATPAPAPPPPPAAVRHATAISGRVADFDVSAAGQVVVRKMEDDNSCLFRAVSYDLDRSRERGDALRRRCAEAVAGDPFTWSQGVLGRPNAEYCRWITNSQTWGGAIELSILSDLYGVEISVFDIQTLRVDHFGEGRGYAHRILLLYDGIHYDSLALTVGGGESSDYTLFATSDDLALAKAFMIAENLNSQGKFTNLANFTLRCSICGEGLQGESGAAKHAMKTGHGQFQEYKK